MRHISLISAVCALCAVATTADACRLSGTAGKCVVAGPPAGEYQSPILRLRDLHQRGEPLQRGTVLPRNKYNVLLLADYYGLPPVKDGWVYMEVERNVYRVDFRTYRVLEMVTDQTAANW